MLSLSGPCVDQFDGILAVRILDCSDHQFLEAVRILSLGNSKIPKRDHPCSSKPDLEDRHPPANPLAAVSRKSRKQRTAITRELAFENGRAAARAEFQQRVNTLEGQVKSLQAELAAAHTELSATQGDLASTKRQLEVARLNQPPPRPTVASASAYLQRIPRLDKQH